MNRYAEKQKTEIRGTFWFHFSPSQESHVFGEKLPQKSEVPVPLACNFLELSCFTNMLPRCYCQL